MRIGIDLGGTKIEGIALDSDGTERARIRSSTPKDDYDAIIRTIVDIVHGLEKQTGEQGSVGVGIPGMVSPKTGLVKNANSTCLIGNHLEDDLATALKRPVRLNNDANCFTVSEATDGSGEGYNMVFGVIVGTGVGGGIVYKGSSHVGINAIGGEWGHNPMPWMRDNENPGPDCYCGKKGCIETFVSGTGLELDYRTSVTSVTTGGQGNLNAQAIVEQAENGDAIAREALCRLEDRLARSLASVINILDPDVIVLGGGISNIDRLYETVPKLWQEWVFSDFTETPLLKNKHGDSSGVRGAAWLWPHDTP